MRRHATPLAATLLAALTLGVAGACVRQDPPRIVPDTTSAPVGDTTGAAAFLDDLQRRTFGFFWETTPPATGLTPDRWPTRSFSSVAAVGFALGAYGIGVERGYVTRAQATERVLNTLRFFWTAPQGPAASGTAGYKGLFYHFLDMDTGTRFQDVELSTIDTALLLGGVLFCQSYFTGSDSAETQIRALADSIYRRVEWTWIQPNKPFVNHRWRPEDGFAPHDWRGYDESMLLYVLAIASPTFPIDSAAWPAWNATNPWGTYYGQEHVNFPPLFGHQYSQMWIDVRGIQDEYMRGKGIDWFENSRRATFAQRAYAIDNPNEWAGYGENMWGLTASDGPIDSSFEVNGRRRTFHTYWARGAAMQGALDDGTLVPTAAGGSIAFAPEIVIPALMEMKRRYGDHLYQKYGFLDAFNPTLTTPMRTQHGTIVPGVGWFDGDYLGIDQGPIIGMTENYRTELIWKTMRKNAHIVRGLRRMGFRGGWLDSLQARPGG